MRPGFIFSKPLKGKHKNPFDTLYPMFRELLVHTSGDVAEALDWLTELDKQYDLTEGQYGIGDFIEDLKQLGYLKEGEDGTLSASPKTEQDMRRGALEQVFGTLKKGKDGQHKTTLPGAGSELGSGFRAFQFGDAPDHINATESIRNAHIRTGHRGGPLSEQDLVVSEQEHSTQTSTVLMIDVSHSMILYGEDRITPAKKVAMALAELIRIRYPKDTLDVLAFGDDAWPIEVKDLPYLSAGPFHTNTIAGLELAMNLLRRRRNPNKQILMITDGKPTCMKEGGKYYKNSFGLDRKIVNRTLDMAAQCRRLHIPITTFMIARDSWLQEFVQRFTEVNAGKAYYTQADGLGSFIMEDFERNRKKRV